MGRHRKHQRLGGIENDRPCQKTNSTKSIYELMVEDMIFTCSNTPVKAFSIRSTDGTPTLNLRDKIALLCHVSSDIKSQNQPKTNV